MAQGKDDQSQSRPATIYQVAEAAGVSPSTVSRAFSRPGRVSDQTAAKIHRIAAELGYRTEAVFRAERPVRTKMIGLLIGDVTNPFYFNIIRGAEVTAAKAGFSIVLADSQESTEREGTLLERSLPVLDGLVIVASRQSDTALRGVSKKVPTVVLNRHVTGLPCVTSDNARGMRRALEHLGELGHRRIAYVAGPEASWVDGMRWRAFRDACSELGLDDFRYGPVHPTVRGGLTASRDIGNHRETAVVCYNDLVAIGVLRGLAQRGISVPGDLSVVGFDNTFASDLVTPAITTVASPLRQLGEEGVRTVLALMKSHQTAVPGLATMPMELVVRESTGPLSSGQ
ncbi:LacI family DNA-binding transcriptional regulator [Luteococcus sp. Sow4_B9]|uniref:LacI family DNA-binding transcriptional regulator n=1 Tax=Luteococcus sp. Sow4_B9 TaxID=3438792 RepID=UPI003F964A7A